MKPTITGTAKWLYRRFRTKRREPGYVKREPGALVEVYQIVLNHLADLAIPIVMSTPLSYATAK